MVYAEDAAKPLNYIIVAGAQTLLHGSQFLKLCIT